jgi:hypothetical protein
VLTLIPKRHRAPADADPIETSSEEEVAEETPTPSRKLRKNKTDEPDIAHAWTAGDRFKSAAATGIIWVFCGAGVLALGANVLGNDAAPEVAAIEVQDAGQSQRVSAFASNFVDLYLSGSRDQEDQIAALLAQGVDTTISLPSEPVEIGEVTPGEAVQVDAGTWVVTVTVERPATAEQPATQQYWQLPVITDETGSIAAAGLPSMVATPGRGDLAVAPGDRVSDSAVEGTLAAFAQAYLAGQGEIAPLTAPGTAITAITPAPYAEASVPSIRTSQEIPADPAEGDVLRTQITVSATTADGSVTQLGYTVDLRWRDRWEVSAINPTSSTPTPTEGDQS